jgi:malonyl CoA-acyl carrier protein transacylase
MKAFMFPGQGSQARGMGGSLFDDFRDLTARADAILGYSIKELCLEDPRKELDSTQFTQPALFVVNALSYYRRMQNASAKPDFLVGHSLGEFNALLAAGCFDFEVGLKLVQKRGQLMSMVTGGGMAAVMNSTPEHIETILRENGLLNVSLANFNTPSQIVISGQKDEIAAAQSLLQKGRVLYFPLKTSGAFHTRFMSEAQTEFKTFLKNFDISPPLIPVISNIAARPYESGEVVETLSSQIASAVRWSDSIQYLLSLASADESIEFEEVGHGDVLTRMVKTIRDQTKKSPQIQGVEIAEKSSRVLISTEPPLISSRSDAPTAEQKVTVWNRDHMIGTKVKSRLIKNETLETRTEAMVLFGHRAAVYLKNFNGYFDLDEIHPV